jgi:hypothetical protein
MSFNFLKAIREKRWTAVNQSLKHGIDLSLIGEDDRSALHWAIELRHEELVRFLLEQAVDLDSIDADGQTAMHLACFYDDLRLVQCLIFCGANPHRVTDDGLNVLHFCAAHGSLEIAKEFVRFGIDYQCQTKESKATPSDVAKEFGHLHMVEFFQEEIKKQEQMMKDCVAKLQEEEDQAMKDRLASNRKSFRFQKQDNPFQGPRSHQDQQDNLSFWGDSPPLSPIYRKKVRFGGSFEDDYGEEEGEDDGPRDEWSDEKSLTECFACESLVEREEDHCSKCGYILHGICPACYSLIDSVTPKDKCPDCHHSLWEEKGFLVPNFSKSSALTIACSECSSQESVHNKFCTACGFVLLDICPSCAAINVKQRKGCPGKTNSDCPFCFDDLWDVLTENPSRRTFQPLKKSAVQTVQNSSVQKASKPEKAPMTYCLACGHGQTIHNDYCEDCFYALSDICPNCLFTPTSLASSCPVCQQSLWSLSKATSQYFSVDLGSSDENLW